MERTVWLWWPFGSHKLRTSGKGLLRPGRICEAISFYSRTDVLWYFWGWRFHSGTHAMWPMQVYLWCMYPYVIFYDTLILIFYWPNSLTYSYGFSAQSLHFVQPAINWCIEGFGQQHHRPPDISDFFMFEFVFGQQQKTLFVNNSNSLQTVFMFEFVFVNISKLFYLFFCFGQQQHRPPDSSGYFSSCAMPSPLPFLLRFHIEVYIFSTSPPIHFVNLENLIPKQIHCTSGSQAITTQQMLCI